MKIIRIDNFNQESVPDELVTENVNEHYGKAITEFLIEKFSSNTSSNFYRLVSDDYKLYVFEA